MRGIINWVGRFIWQAVCIMTGALSLFRDALATFNPGTAPPRTIFWNLVSIAFIISAWVLWNREHKKAERNKPIFQGDFHVFAAAMGGDENESSIFTIYGLITNTGSPSIVKNINVTFTRGPKEFVGEFPILGLGGIALDGGGDVFVIPEDQKLLRKFLASPIQTGGAINGYFVAFFRDLEINDAYGEGVVLTIEVDDVLGKKHTFLADPLKRNIKPLTAANLQKKPSPPSTPID